MRTPLSLALVVITVAATTFAAVPVGADAPAPVRADTVSADATQAQETDATQAQDDETQTQDDAPPDPESDVIGWEDGYWYNESLSVTAADGLNDTELERVVARSMARVERIRQLEFDGAVPVEVVARDEFQRPGRESVPPAFRTFDNAKYEALFMINESTDSLAVQARNSGTSVGGFYSPANERIVVVSENTTSPQLDELTLGHELVHALQDQQFGLAEFNQSTREQHNSIDGLVEGDANYVQYVYERRCNDEWAGSCLGITEEEQGATGTLANVGPYLIKYQPYSDGPPFLESIRSDGGWEAVNELYRDPPASTEQVIHPDLYGEDQPQPVTIRDRSNDAWDRLDVPGRVDHGELGEAGLFSMLLYPGIATGGEQTVIPPQTFFAAAQQADGPMLDPYNYSHPATAGWDGDRLAVYVNDDAPPNETGYVWRTVWDSERDAEQFVDAYRELLEIRGAQKVEDRQNTWTIPDDREFADAFHVRQRGDTVTIVNAPTVDQLPGVYGGVSNDSSQARSDSSQTGANSS